FASAGTERTPKSVRALRAGRVARQCRFGTTVVNHGRRSATRLDGVRDELNRSVTHQHVDTALVPARRWEQSGLPRVVATTDGGVGRQDGEHRREVRTRVSPLESTSASGRLRWDARSPELGALRVNLTIINAKVRVV